MYKIILLMLLTFASNSVTAEWVPIDSPLIVNLLQNDPLEKQTADQLKLKKVQEELDRIVSSSRAADEEHINRLQMENSLIGKSTLQKQILRSEYESNLELKRKFAEIDNITKDVRSIKIAQLQAESAARIKIIRDKHKARTDPENDLIFKQMINETLPGASPETIKEVTWKVIASSEENIDKSTYVDLSTLRNEGHKAKMWLMMDFKDYVGHMEYSHLSTIKEMEYDCKNKQSRILAVKWHLENMGNGTVVMSDKNISEWKPIVPNSKLEKLWTTVCETKRSNNNSIPEWIKLGSMANKTTTLYANLNEINKNDNIATIWDLLDYMTARTLTNGTEMYMSEKQKFEFNCNEKQFRSLAITFHSENMGKGTLIRSLINERVNWEPVPPNYAMESLWKSACGIK